MSLEGDARDCLIKAVKAKNNVVLDLADLNTVKPKDRGFDHDNVSWRQALEHAGRCLAAKGYTPPAPSNTDAGKLIGKPMVHSVDYLAANSSRSRTARLVFAGVATAAVVGGAAAIIIRSRRKRRTRP